MGVGRVGRLGYLGPLDFEIQHFPNTFLAKKDCFLSFERVKSSGDSRMKKVGGHCGAKEKLGGAT